MSKRTVVVAAAVVRRGETFLLTRRLEGTHLAGLWEFPGGKCEPGETHDECLRREIVEELGCRTHVGDKIMVVAHDYEDRVVELHFFECALDGDPVPLLGQEIRWVRRDELRTVPLPPADADLITLLAG